MRLSIKNTSFFAIIVLFWGGSFLGIYYVVESFPPVFGAFLRVLTAFVAICALLPFRQRYRVRWDIKLKAMLAGVLNLGISWIFLFNAERFISPALSAIYNSSTTIFVAVLTPFFLPRGTLTRKGALGVVLGFAGILVVFLPGISKDAAAQIWGQVALVSMAVCYGAGTILIKKIGHSIGSVQALFYQSIGALLVLGIYCVIFEAPWNIDFSSIPQVAWLSVLYLGVCSTLIAWLLYMRLIREWGAVRASSATYLVPLISIFLDGAILGKLVSPNAVVGAAVIFSGIWMIQKRKRN